MEFENLLTLIRTVSESELTGFKYEENGVKVQLSKQQDKVQIVAAGQTVPTEQYPAEALVRTGIKEDSTQAEVQEKPVKESPKGHVVESPLVGTFYTAPSEDAQPFAAVGDTVKKGQTLAIVEAMKLMNEIESDFDGIVTEIFVENGQAVEYGQPLFCIG